MVPGYIITGVIEILPGPNVALLLEALIAQKGVHFQHCKKTKGSEEIVWFARRISFTASSSHCYLCALLVHSQRVRMALLADPRGHGRVLKHRRNNSKRLQTGVTFPGVPWSQFPSPDLRNLLELL